MHHAPRTLTPPQIEKVEERRSPTNTNAGLGAPFFFLSLPCLVRPDVDYDVTASIRNRDARYGDLRS